MSDLYDLIMYESFAAKFLTMLVHKKNSYLIYVNVLQNKSNHSKTNPQ